MRLIFMMMGCVFIVCDLAGCDVFWVAKFTQVQQTNATFAAQNYSDEDKLNDELKAFALKYGLKCETEKNSLESMTCYSNSYSKVSGGFGIAKNDARPTINYRDAAAGGAAFFSKNDYCAHAADIRKKLEEFVGPLDMKVSHTGGPPYNDCK